MEITPIPDEPAKPMEDEIEDVFCRLRSTYTDDQVIQAIDSMDEAAKFNLIQSLHDLEQNIRLQ